MEVVGKYDTSGEGHGRSRFAHSEDLDSLLRSPDLFWNSMMTTAARKLAELTQTLRERKIGIDGTKKFLTTLVFRGQTWSNR